MNEKDYYELEDFADQVLKDFEALREYVVKEEKTNWKAITLLWSKLSKEQKEDILNNSEYPSDVVGAIRCGVNCNLHSQAVASGKDPHSEEVTSQYI